MWIEKSVTRDYCYSASLVMLISDPHDRFFYPHHTPMKDTYSHFMSSLILYCIIYLDLSVPVFRSGCVAQSVGHLTRKSGVLGSIPGLATYFHFPSAFSRRAVVSYWGKYVHEVLVNRLGGLSLPRKSVVRLTDRPNMTLDVYRGRKTTIQQQQQPIFRNFTVLFQIFFQEKDHSDVRLKGVIDHLLHQTFVKYTFGHILVKGHIVVQRRGVEEPLLQQQTTRIIYVFIQVIMLR